MYFSCLLTQKLLATNAQNTKSIGSLDVSHSWRLAYFLFPKLLLPFLRCNQRNSNGECGSLTLCTYEADRSTLSLHSTFCHKETESVSGYIEHIARAEELGEHLLLLGLRNTTTSVFNDVLHHIAFYCHMEFHTPILRCVLHGIAQEVLQCHTHEAPIQHGNRQLLRDGDTKFHLLLLRLRLYDSQDFL